MSTAEKFEVLQAELDQALAEILKLKRQLQDQGEPLTDDKILEMADKAFGQIVDYDLHGNPITDFRVLTIGAYGPAIRRLVRLARSHADPAEVERLSADRDDLQRYADELNDERCGFEKKIDTLHAQLAESHALLSEWRRTWGAQYRSDSAILLKTDAALSASAEPSAPVGGISRDLAHRGPSAKPSESLVHYGPPATAMPAGAKTEHTLEITGWKYESYKPRDPKYHIHLDDGLPKPTRTYSSYRVFLVGAKDSAGKGARKVLLYNQGDTLVIDGETYILGRLELKS